VSGEQSVRADAGLVLRGLVEAARLPFWQGLGRPNHHADPFWKPAAVERLAAGSPLEAAMLGLFLAGRPLEAARVRTALGAETTDLLLAAGILVAEGPDLRSPHLLVSYLNRHVLAAPPPAHARFEAAAAPYCGPESLWYARLVALRGPYRRALDLCSGTGLIAMLPQAAAVVAVELDPNAVAVAEVNLALNLVDHVELRQGDLFAPVAAERFDLVTANPPFLPDAPDGRLPLCGRGGRRGDELLERLLREAADHLAPGGEALIYAEGFGDARGPAILARLEQATLSSRHDHHCLIGATQSGERAAMNLTRLWQRLGLAEDAAWAHWRELAAELPASHYHHCLWRITDGSGRLTAERMFVA
jgi:SAM-dependent methyltransferase